MKCVNCDREFEAERSTARFCGGSCRKAYNRLSVAKYDDLSVTLDLVKDLKLDMRKDLGVRAWTEDGIFIRDDITEGQVRAIRDLVAAKNGWPAERGFLYWCGEHKQYKPCGCA